MYLFQERKLSETFSARNVVLEGFAVKSKKNDLIFSVALDFGFQGVLRRTTAFQVTDRSMKDILHDIHLYQDILLDIIDALEEQKRWFINGTDAQLVRTIHASSPLLFNGVRGAKFLRLEIYGKGLHDFSLQFEYREGGSIQSLLDRLEEMANWVRRHLKAIDNLPMEAFVGAKA